MAPRNTPTRSPVADVAAAVLKFLWDNPEERLAPSDVAAKFDCSALAVHTHLSEAVRKGHLQREVDPDGETAYRLGPNAHQAKPGPKPRFVMPDPSTLKIDKDVHLPGTRAGIDNTAAYQALFKRLSVGDSVLLPLQAKSTLAHAATSWKKQTAQQLALRTSDEGVRVWRVS
jgi:hypothetical protein